MRVQPKGLLARILFSKPGKVFLLLVILLNVAALTAFTYYYARYAKIVDQKLAEGPFQNTSLLYSAPDEVAVGDAATPEEIAAQLRRAGYSENRTNKMGWYHLRPDAVEIFPGTESYYRQEPGVVKFAAGKVSQIISLRDNTSRNQYMM